MNIQLPEGGKYLERVPGGDMEKPLPSVTAFYQQLLGKLSAIPGVESAAFGSSAPARGAGGFYSFSILSHPAPPPEKRPQAGYDEVSPGFFQTLEIPLRKGRYIDEHDTQSAPWVVVINETFARRYFPNEDPIGQQLRLRYDPYPVDEERPRQIVGIVGDVKHFGLGEETPAFMYASYLQQPGVFPGGAVIAHLSQALLLRGKRGVGGEFAPAVKRAVAELDPDQACNEYYEHGPGDVSVHVHFAFLFAFDGSLRRHGAAARRSRHLRSNVVFRQGTHTRDWRASRFGCTTRRRARPRSQVGDQTHTFWSRGWSRFGAGTHTFHRQHSLRSQTDGPAYLCSGWDGVDCGGAARLLHSGAPGYKSRPDGVVALRITFRLAAVPRFSAPPLQQQPVVHPPPDSSPWR